MRKKVSKNYLTLKCIVNNDFLLMDELISNYKKRKYWTFVQNFLCGVVKVTTLEPFDNEIISENKTTCDNKYAHLICVMKESTFEYYNMRIALGLECT